MTTVVDGTAVGAVVAVSTDVGRSAGSWRLDRDAIPSVTTTALNRAAAALPLGVTVTAAVLGGVTYTTTVGGKPATVTWRFGPAKDPSPVTAPG